MAKVQGKMVVEVGAIIDGAVKNLKSVKAEFGLYQDLLKQIDASEKAYGKTLETTETKMMLKGKQLKLTEQNTANLKKRQEELIKVEESGLSLSKKEQKELERITREIQKQSTTKTKLTNDNKGLQETMVRLTSETERQSKSLTELQREYDEASRKLDSYNQKVKNGETLTAEQVSEYKELKSTMSSLESETSGLVTASDKYNESIKKNIRDTKTLGSAYKDLKGTWSDLKGNFKDIKDGVTTLATPAIVTGTAGFTQFLNQEEQELDVMRFTRGTDEQNKLVQDQMREIFVTRPEDNSEITALMESIIKTIQPENYGTEFGSAVEDVLNFAMTTSLSYEEAGEYISKWLTLTDYGWDDIPKLTSSINALENSFSVDAGGVTKGATMLYSQADQIGFDWTEIVALVGAANKTSTRGEDATAQGLLEVMSLLTDARAMGVATEAVYDKNGKLKKAADDGISDIQKDLMRYTNTNSVEDLIDMMDRDSMGVLMAYIEGLKAEGATENLSALIASKEYLSSGRVAQETVSNLIKMSDVIGDYVGAANEGYESGTAVDEEAEDVLNTTKNRLKVFWSMIQGELFYLGESMAPHIIAFIDRLEPYVGLIRKAADWMRGMDPDIVADWLHNFTKLTVQIKLAGALFKIFTGIGGAGMNLFKLGKNFQSLFKVLFGAKTATDMTTTATAAKGLAAAFSGKAGLAGALAGLGPILVGLLGAVSLVALGIVAQKSMIEKAQDKRIYGDLDDRLTKQTKEDIEVGRGAGAQLALAGRHHTGIDLDRVDLTNITDQVDNMFDRIQKDLQDDLDGYVYSESKYESVNKALSEHNKVIGEEAQALLDESTSIKEQIDSLVSQAIEGNIETDEAFVDKLNGLRDRFNEISAEVRAVNEVERNQLKRAYKSNVNLEELETKEDKQNALNALNKLWEDEIERFRERDGVYADLLHANRNNPEEYAKLTEDRERHRRNHQNQLMYYRSDIDSVIDSGKHFGHFTMFGGSEVYKNTRDINGLDIDEIKKVSDILQSLNKFDRLSITVDPEDLNFANQFMDRLEVYRNNPIGLAKLSGEDDFAVIIDMILTDGIGALHHFRDAYGDMLEAEDPRYFTKLSKEAYRALKEMDLAFDEMTKEQKELYIWSNFDENITSLFELHGLWDNKEFIDKFIRLDNSDGISSVYELMREYSEIPDQIDTQLLANVQNVMTNTSLAKYELDRINGYTATTYIRTHYVTSGHQAIDNTLRKTGQNSLLQKYTTNNVIGTRYAYADGTSLGGHPVTGPAIVGDGGQHEVVVPTLGQPYITPDTPTIVNLPSGSTVFKSIEDFLMNRQSFGLNIPMYASGTMNAQQLMTATQAGDININVTSDPGMSNLAGKIKKAVKQVIDEDKREKSRYEIYRG